VVFGRTIRRLSSFGGAVNLATLRLIICNTRLGTLHN